MQGKIMWKFRDCRPNYFRGLASQLSSLPCSAWHSGACWVPGQMATSDFKRVSRGSLVPLENCLFLWQQTAGTTNKNTRMHLPTADGLLFIWAVATIKALIVKSLPRWYEGSKQSSLLTAAGGYLPLSSSQCTGQAASTWVCLFKHRLWHLLLWPSLLNSSYQSSMQLSCCRV